MSETNVKVLRLKKRRRLLLLQQLTKVRTQQLICEPLSLSLSLQYPPLFPLSSTHTQAVHPPLPPAFPLFAMCVSVEYGKYIKVDRANSDSLHPAPSSCSLPLSALIHIQPPPPPSLPRPYVHVLVLCRAVSCAAHHCPRFSCSAQKMQRGKREKRNAFWPRKVKRLNFNKPLILILIVAANGRLRGSAMIRMGCTCQER